MEGPEAIFEIADPAARVQGFLVVGSTRLGPAFGGIRIKAYAHERDALVDAIDLAGAMTVKAALAGLDCGGGKIVLIDRRGFDRPRAMTLLGRTLDELGGLFFAGRDYGMTSEDLARLRRATRFAADESPSALGDLGAATARGTLAALRAALLHADSQHGSRTRIRRGPRRSPGRRESGSAPPLMPLGVLRSLARVATLAAATNGGGTGSARDEDDRLAVGPAPGSDVLAGARVAVQGAGSVGVAIVRQLLAAGADVVAADPDPRAAKRAAAAGATVVSPERLAAARVDAFVPAATGRLLDQAFAARSRAAVVCGPANNALVSHDVERRLRERGIVYVPDVLASAGALIAGVFHHLGPRACRFALPGRPRLRSVPDSPRRRVRGADGIDESARAIDAIGPRVALFLRGVERSGRLPSEEAERIAAARLRRGPRRTHGIRTDTVTRRFRE